MAAKNKTQGKSADKLSKQRIVAAAISILDNEGESALTFRTLASVLSTGSGAIYWHIANKTELLAAATEVVMNPAPGTEETDASPEEVIRILSLAAFDVIDAHPWVGNQLIREPGRGAMLRLGEDIGAQLHRMGIAGSERFDIWSALVNYILGVASQNSANARIQLPGVDRETFLTAVAARWSKLSAEQYPFMVGMAKYLPDHNDRQQFITGIDLILKGIRSLKQG